MLLKVKETDTHEQNITFCTEQAFVRTYCKNINVLHRGMFYLLTPNTIKGERLQYVVQQKGKLRLW